MKTVISVLVAIIVIGGGLYWYAYMMPAAQTQTPSTDTTTNTTTDTQANNGTDNVTGSTGVNADVGATAGVSTSVTVSYTAAGGFSPSSITIKKGGTVTWVNKDTGQMWVASANHPTHTVYSGTTLQQHCDTQSNDSFDQCQNGTSYSFQFTKLGKWNYHNHSNASKFGSVTVVE